MNSNAYADARTMLFTIMQMLMEQEVEVIQAGGCSSISTYFFLKDLHDSLPKHLKPIAREAVAKYSEDAPSSLYVPNLLHL